MAKAFKCDRCGVYFDVKGVQEGADMSGRFTHKLRPGWYPESVDLCRECAELLIVLLAEWWEV